MMRFLQQYIDQISQYFSQLFQAEKETEIKCPYCFETSQITMKDSFDCPKCYEHIPPSFVKKDAKFISIIGPKNSSKTTYLTLLAFGLQKGVKLFEKEGISCNIVGGSEAKRTLENNISTMLIEEELVLGTTDLESTLLIQINISKGRRSKNIFLSFRDYQGESINEFKGFLKNSNVIDSSGVIYLFDPLYSPAFVEKLEGQMVRGKKLRLDPSLILNSNYTSHINMLNEALLTKSTKSFFTSKINIPIAVAITKYDLLIKILGAMATPDPNSMAITDKESFINQLDTYSDHLEYQINRIDPKLITLLNNYFSKFKLFALSPLGFDPDSIDTTISGKNIKSIGLFNPLIWLLREIKFI